MTKCLRITCLVCLSFAMGCSSKNDLKLVPAGGTVTFNGQPLASATVMFVPAKGPMAAGTTDKDGKFELKTKDRRGIAPGDAKVSVSVPTDTVVAGTVGVALQPKTAAEAQEYMKKADEIRRAVASGKTSLQQASVIPEKYTKFETSGLSYTIKPTGENQFQISLTEE